MQTAFQTITSLFLIFVLFAYLSSQGEEKFSISISPKIVNSIKVITALLLVVLLYFVVYTPLKQSSILTTLEGAGTFNKRIEVYKENEESIKNLSISPDQTVQLYVNKYISALAPHIDIVYENNQVEQAKEEILQYLDFYETYYPQYKNKYKFLIYYAHAINFASMVEADRLERGEELLNEALAISKTYPQPYLALAVNLYNQGKTKEALAYAKQAYDIDPTIIKSKELLETLETRAKFSKSQHSPLYLPGL